MAMVRNIGTHSGETVREIALRNAVGASASIITFGASLRDLQVPTPAGPQRVVLGFETLEGYVAQTAHVGATAGRFANRIGGGKFALDGTSYDIPRNQAGKHALHGGGDGFGRRVWALLHADDRSATLGLYSPDGDAGFPGGLSVTCRYLLLEPAILRVEMSAITDAPTIVNLAHHSYFNLGSEDILDHTIEIRSNVITPVDADLIPDGTVAAVSGTPYDFRTARTIRQLNADGSRFRYDQNYLLRRSMSETLADGQEIAHAATLTNPANGLCMQVFTSEPALQFYDGSMLSTPTAGFSGAPYGANAGLCLEPQKVPDSPNLPHFPSATLRPGAVYRQVTDYRFSLA